MEEERLVIPELEELRGYVSDGFLTEIQVEILSDKLRGSPCEDLERAYSLSGPTPSHIACAAPLYALSGSLRYQRGQIRTFPPPIQKNSQSLSLMHVMKSTVLQHHGPCISRWTYEKEDLSVR